MKKFVVLFTVLLTLSSTVGFGAEKVEVDGSVLIPDKLISGTMDVFDDDDNGEKSLKDDYLGYLSNSDDLIDITLECENDISDYGFSSQDLTDQIKFFTVDGEPTEFESEPIKANNALKKTKSVKKQNTIVKNLNKKYLSLLTSYTAKLQKDFKGIWAKITKKNPKFNKLKIKKVTIEPNKEAGFSLDGIKDAIDKKDWYTKRTTLKDIFSWDTEVWLKTLFSPNLNHKDKKQIQMRETLIRIFVLLNEGGMMYRPTEKDGWYNYKHPTASIISHGGRVLVAVKKSAKLSKRAITNWIFTGKATGDKQKTNKTINFKKRFASTHRTIFVENRVEEEKLSVGKGLKKLSLKKASNFSNNYAFNVPLGGYGSEGADGSPVKANGRFAHLLVILNDAKKSNKVWQTAFQIGVEHSEPIFFSKPYAPKGHLGTSHGLGGSESMSIMNTPKFSELSKKFKTVPANYNCMRIVVDSNKEFMNIQKSAKSLIGIANLKAQKKALLKLLQSAPKATLENEGMTDIDL